MKNEEIINILEDILNKMKKIENDKTLYNPERNSSLYAQLHILELIFRLKGVNLIKEND